jgi:5-methylcytosine-specific restriction enzyme B
LDTKSEEYELKGPDADAKGVFTDNGFLVKVGSFARRETVPSGKSVSSVHQRLITEGVLEDHDGQLRFVKDHLFKSPSGAAAAVLGRTANGWISWKRADGQTLSEIKRVSRDEKIHLLDEANRKKIIGCHQQLEDDGKLRTKEQLDKEYALFRERFGPSVLKGLDGESLLTFMHDHSNKDSLVYWLEFKNDEEFETREFGSIAGGSALKFRIFRRKETGNWQAGGDQGNRPEDITVEEAVNFARSHRDQFIKGCELLEAFPPQATDEDYAELQDQMDELAPDVSRLAWGHKYFSLMFPAKLDDYHSPIYQRFHLLKLLQMPPEGDGRYICAGRFVAAANEVGLSMNHFTSTLNSVQGGPHRYWRIGTSSGKSGTSYWQMMRERSCVAVGWPKLGDISWVEAKQESRKKLKALLDEVHPNHPSAIGRDCSQLVQFVVEIAEGDIVLSANGMTILGIGRVVGGYEYQSEFDFPHQRPVEWLTCNEWQMPESSEGLQSTVRELGKFNDNLLAIEQRIQSSDISKKDDDENGGKPKRPLRLSGIPGRIQSVLDRKGQVILYGPPGTGKTYWAEKTANDLAAISVFGKLYESLNETEKKAVLGEGQSSGVVRLCCFHPAYGYEDFLEGYRPETVDGKVSFKLRDGVFKSLCHDASESPERNFYLIIDEINRGDIPRIFGELLTTLEKDKRGKRIVLPVSQEVFSVPKNVFLIGTMNTADRSISLLDAALRRRFGFFELMPDGTVLKDSVISGIPLRAWFDTLNTRIREHVGRDARNLQIGHSYLMQSGSPLKDLASLKRAIRDDIIPLLEEYCYNDYTTLATILGDQLVDSAAQRVCHELFDDGSESYLIQALLAPCPEITASSEAVSSEESLSEPEEADGGEGDEETDQQ